MAYPNSFSDAKSANPDFSTSNSIKIHQFRSKISLFDLNFSQISKFCHRYCSNQYPKAESYKSCNWCLTQKHESGKSTSPSSPGINNSGDDHRDHDVRNKRNADDKTSLIKKLHGLSPEKESPKRTAGGIVEEKNHVVLRKSKSANHLAIGGGIKAKPLFKNRVRRYKLLDEVSGQ
ncbi:hypothetical protein R6Q57_002425 [Mikania cordata]